MARLIVFLSFIAGSSHCFGQSNSVLPNPTGPYKVGRMSLSWVDRSRPEVMTANPDDYREVMVYVWYPASNVSGIEGPYMPGAERLRGVAASVGLNNAFGPVWARIETNELRAHSFDNAQILAERKLPVLVFTPGGGATPIAYTTQLEELASHGYLVVGVVHTYEAPAVVFPDNRVVTAANDYWTRLRSQITDPGELERSISDILAQDIRFVIDRLIALNSDRTSMLFGRLNTTRFGVFGHSRGGRTAARVCQLDPRITACLSEDGSFSWQPFWLDASGASMKQPFMMIEHLDPELPDEAFSQMGTTREAYAANRASKKDEAREKIYKTIRGGSYQLTISTPGISHNSFSDVRLLGRQDAAAMNIWPKDVQAITPHARILSVVTTYVRAFFDKYVQEIPAPLLGASPPMPDVEIRRYGAAEK